jgi:hypothetical protein
MGKNSGQLEFTDWRWTGMEVVTPHTAPDFEKGTT